jgi:glutaredoxin-like protein NrdH
MKVCLYALSTCTWCRKTKKFLRKNHIPFDYIDHDLQNKTEQIRIIKEMADLGGGNAFPMVVIGEAVIIGYNPERISIVLGLKKEKNL